MSRFFIKWVLALSVVLATSSVGNAAEAFVCEVQHKFESERAYSKEHIEKSQFSVRIIDNGSSFVMKRCSYTMSANAVTCDEYDGDYKTIDSNIDLRKYYYFAGQFDVQIFTDGFFVENNGRAGIAFGRCNRL